MSKLYEMTQADMDELLKSMQPVPYIIIGGFEPPSQQENANNAWKRLGEKMGFEHMSVKPSNKGELFFTATPKEVEFYE